MLYCPRSAISQLEEYNCEDAEVEGQLAYGVYSAIVKIPNELLKEVRSKAERNRNVTA